MQGLGVAGRTYNRGMPYIAKATMIDSVASTWLTTPRLHGWRTFGPRDLAETFGTEAEVRAAILAMIDAEDCRGIQFAIEAAD